MGGCAYLVTGVLSGFSETGGAVLSKFGCHFQQQVSSFATGHGTNPSFPDPKIPAFCLGSLRRAALLGIESMHIFESLSAAGIDLASIAILIHLASINEPLQHWLLYGSLSSDVIHGI